MIRGLPGWTARVRIRRPDPASAERMRRALVPEAGREVPRSRARISRPVDREIVLELAAEDTGSMRAALNAYLGWIRLAIAAENIARATSGPTERATGSRGPKRLSSAPRLPARGSTGKAPE